MFHHGCRYGGLLLLALAFGTAAAGCSEEAAGSCEHLCALHATDLGWTPAEESDCVVSCTDALAGVCTAPFCVWGSDVCTWRDPAEVQQCTRGVIDAVAPYGDWTSARDAFLEAFCGAVPCCVLDHNC